MLRCIGVCFTNGVTVDDSCENTEVCGTMSQLTFRVVERSRMIQKAKVRVDISYDIIKHVLRAVVHKPTEGDRGTGMQQL